MRVISGKFKGMEIPFINDKFDNANASPQKVKKALFSMLGEDLSGRSFLDLYACSGQIGIEALSRGAYPVVFSEIDKKRYRFIKSLIERWGLEESALIFNYHAFRCLRLMHSRNYEFDFIYIDAPYFKAGRNDHYGLVMNELNKYDVLKSKGSIIIQHLSKQKLAFDPGKFSNIAVKSYAKNSLSVFRKA